MKLNFYFIFIKKFILLDDFYTLQVHTYSLQICRLPSFCNNKNALKIWWNIGQIETIFLYRFMVLYMLLCKVTRTYSIERLFSTV